MFTYTPVWMGPVDKIWNAENKYSYSFGRLNVYDSNKFTGKVVSIPLMASDDYVAFTAWAANCASEQILSFEELREMFEEIYFELEIYDEWYNGMFLP